MEERKRSGSSTLADELFGPKESPVSCSSGRFGSIFRPTPPPKVVRSESPCPEENEKKSDSDNQAANTKISPLAEANNDKISQGEQTSDPNKDRSSFYEVVQMMQTPCTLSSSIYYGGQDILMHPRSQNTHRSVYATVSS
ncbi:OLC1v1020628C1 [Oldenlandia corymbosa var. corymbosa]|uniref:OLC1v1020628C1 n=1 Tax=Oldenlandia corymbosa var. corymbosa TaxID=529605 RepID=A0AAV1EHC9_OLDCO|nr:OLC1v1020628C1 [Oldenlandia corymbosa var. corymbosa]